MTDTHAGAAGAGGRKIAVVTVGILAVICLTQWICRSAISRDEMENIRWGQALAWGSEKHPPLFGWIHYGWVQLFSRADLSTYLLEKANYAAGFLLLYLLVRRLLGRERAVLAMALTLGTAYSMLICLKYNATSAMWPFWTGYLLCLHRAWKGGTAAWWMATGLMAGLAVLTKYHSLLLVACSFGFLVSGPDGRRRLADWRPWCGVAVGMAVLAPHIAWVWHHGGATVGYAIENVTEGSSLARHLGAPLKYAAIQALCLLPALGLMIRWARRDPGPAAGSDESGTLRFLFWHGPVLGLAPAALSLVGGISLGGLWGMTSWGLFPAWMLARFDIEPRTGHLKTALTAAAGLVALVVVLYFTNTIFIAEQRDYKGAAAAVQRAWQERYETPLTVVGGDDRYYEGLGIYLPGHPDVFGRLDPSYHPAIDMGRIERGGAVIVIPEGDDTALGQARARFPVDETIVLELPARRDGIRRIRAERLVVMFVSPDSGAGARQSGSGAGDGGP